MTDQVKKTRKRMRLWIEATIGVCVLAFIVLALVQAALQGVYSAALYRYATANDAGGAFSGELLQSVGLRREVGDMFPHELSGGMKQRVCIAISICLRPKLIIADEPTSALDVVVQRQVMATLARVQQELGAAVILIGHDMGLMAQFLDRLGVMYAGRLVEVAPIAAIITRPSHPYTRALIAPLPSLEMRAVLAGIPGLAPLLRDLPPGCAFHPRCTLATDRCRTEKPSLRGIEGAQVACHLA